ncbi:MAG: DUF308 domain-containing protein, partial [Erysipelotrichales bacterium]
NIALHVSIALVGFWILINPSVGIDFFRYYLGIILVLGSFIMFAFYKRSKDNDKRFLLQAILLFVFGAFFIVSNKFSMMTLGFILISWMAFEAVVNLNLAFVYHKLNVKGWFTFLVYAIITIICAVIVFFNISASAMLLIQITAIFTVIRSIITVVDLLFFKKYVDDSVVLINK